MSPEITARPPKRGSRWTVRYGSSSEKIDPDSDAEIEKLAKRWGVDAASIKAAFSSGPGSLEVAPLGPGFHAWVGHSDWCVVSLDGLIDFRTGAYYHEPNTLVFRAAEDPWGKVSALARALLALIRTKAGSITNRARLENEVTISDPPVLGDDADPGEVAALSMPMVEAVDVTEWMAARGWQPGDRRPHEECPINPGPSSRSPIRLGDYAFTCYKCNQVWSYARAAGLVAYEQDRLREAAEALVHWHHAKFLVDHYWPDSVPKNLGTIDLRKIFWYALVRAIHAPRVEDDETLLKLVPRVMDPALLFVRSDSGAWLHSETFQPVELDKRAISALPLTRGHPATVILASGPHDLQGVAPIHITPVSLETNSDKVIVETRPELKPEPYLSPEEAYKAVEVAYPGVQRKNLRALLVAAVCARRSPVPIIMAAVGPTGSGKTTTPELAAAIMGGEVANLSHEVCSDRQDGVARAIGSAAASPQTTCIIVDEVDKISRPRSTFLRPILNVKTFVTYRPLYSTGQVSVRLTCPLVFTSISAPDFYGDPEVARRLTLLRYRYSVQWEQDPSDWVSLSPKAAASLLYHAIRDAERWSYNWRQVVVGLKLTPMTQEQVALPMEMRQQIASTVRTATPSKAGRLAGWIDLTGHAARVIDEILPDVPPSVNPLVILARNLTAVDWSAESLSLEFRTYRGRLYARNNAEDIN